MRATGRLSLALFSCLLLPSAVALAQESESWKIPTIVQSHPHFFGAVANGDLDVTWRVDRNEITTDDTLTLTLHIRNAKNPADILRPDLTKLAPIPDAFLILDRPASDSNTAGQEVRFVYQLRPRRTGKLEIPSLVFAYFNPARPNSPLPEKILEPIAITVRASEIPETNGISRTLPAVFFDEPAIAQSPFPVEAPTRMHWSLLLGVIACGCVCVILAKSWLQQTSRKPQLRFARSTRKALTSLNALTMSQDLAKEISHVVYEYLQDRCGVTLTALSSKSLELLRDENQIRSFELDKLQALLQALDRARYSQRAISGPQLVDLTRQVILDLEDAPC